MSEINYIRKRGALKAKVKNFKIVVDNIQTQEVTQIKYEELEVRLDRMANIMKEFDEIQDKIEAESENYDEQLKERELFENGYYEVIAAAQLILKQRNIENNKIGEANDRQDSSMELLAFSQQKGNTNVKLPQIHLPRFNGNYEHWLEFRDTFQSLIHNNDTLDPIQKFHYLRAALADGASQVIRSIEFSAHNYKTAWDILCQRYNNEALLVRNHLKALFDIQPLSKESAVDIRNLIDDISKHLRSLTNLGQPTEYWDTIIIYLVTQKLDKTTAREWEEQKKQDSLPTFSEFMAFLKSRADLLETLDTKRTEPGKFKRESQTRGHYSFLSSKQSCPVCKGTHYIFNCTEFLTLSIPTRIERVKGLRLCINCLRPGHIVKNCTSGKCQKCKAKHNTLLHLERDPNPNQDNDQSLVLSVQNTHLFQQVLLSTALVQVTDNNGYPKTCRIILDSGSQSNFITNRLCTTLGLPTTSVRSSILGVNRSVSKITHKCSLTLQSLHSSYETSITCLVLDSITDDLPEIPIDMKTLNIPSHVRLADPEFFKPGQVDLLIGAGLFWQLLCIGQYSLGKNKPTLQKTRFGWIVAGNVCPKPTNSKIHCNLALDQQLHAQMERFWKLEDFAERTPMSKEDKVCEEIFTSTVERNETGRFMVALPLKESAKHLGDSKNMAMTRFTQLERRLDRNNDLKQEYVRFLTEYKELGHMVESQAEEETVNYFLPHHGVYNQNSTTTKLRVVFDGSAKTDTGLSLNDVMHRGPNVQEDLLAIILRFRQWQYVVSGDIKKMYRQILVKPEHRKFQKILWRTNTNEKIKTFELNTVTYGTKAAPYLAVRCLKHLAYENHTQHPEASRVILSDFYVDDMITGGNTTYETIEKVKTVSKILASAGFELHKWGTNEPEILECLQPGLRAKRIDFDDNDAKKTVGLYWSCAQDTLQFNIESMKNQRVTKRTILSDIAHIYDPLGLLSPCIIIAKIILQNLWTCKLTWDESIPADIYTKWKALRIELSVLNKLQLPRYVIGSNSSQVELHGFSDASQNAYGACIYTRTKVKDKYVVNLLCAKNRVAPLKKTTIPRLELCSAVLLSQLIQKVQKTSQITFERVYLWSDSSIVLHWIHTPANLLQPFVGNRVEQIQTITKQEDWRHIRSHHNPADLLTRGISPKDLLNAELWWKGPSWLAESYVKWPEATFEFTNRPPELRKQIKSLAHYQTFDIFNRFSNFTKLKRVVAYCFRFVNNCRKRRCERLTGLMTSNEIHNATNILISLCQQQCFAAELKLLRDHQNSKKIGKLQKLCPVLDNNGIIRVGGRLHNSNFNYEKKHPAILPKTHKFTILVFKDEHLKMGHAGPQLLLASVREYFWPIGGRSTARKIVHQCITCSRMNPTQINPIMGLLPKERVTPSLPFTSTGVDYAGPFLLKDRMGRGARTSKCYICLFICFTTKAIHLELVTSLSKDAFLAAFSRFTSRRGIPTHIFSDNGKNFVSAHRDLKELSAYLNLNENSIISSLASRGITWHFIPTYAPHFGGIWEAGVKSTKYHLKRIMGHEKLTYEQFYTVLTLIEGILNSRPLTPLSSDPSDLNALTPSHFLLGRRLLTLPDSTNMNTPPWKLSKWEHIQQLRQHFWRRWATEYISELQIRQKWATSHGQLQTNTLVLIKEENLPPLQWKLGRIVELHPGIDGISRVASIKTQTGVVKRAFSKICPLPILETET